LHSVAQQLKRAPRGVGTEHYLAVYHKSRSFCCAQVGDPSTCVLALHEARAASLADTARAALAAGHSCITYEFLMDYAAIRGSLQQLAGGSADVRALPSHVVSSAALHTIKDGHDVSFYRAEVDAFLQAAAAPAWRNTAFVMHGCTSPNATAITAGNYPQRQDVVRSFNAALRDALAAAAQRAEAPLPRLVEYYSVTGEDARARFPYNDAVHFSSPFYQTAFVVDALVLRAAVCSRDVALAAI
jgi:hypothetical protein